MHGTAAQTTDAVVERALLQTVQLYDDYVRSSHVDGNVRLAEWQRRQLEKDTEALIGLYGDILHHCVRQRTDLKHIISRLPYLIQRYNGITMHDDFVKQFEEVYDKLRKLTIDACIYSAHGTSCLATNKMKEIALHNELEINQSPCGVLSNELLRSWQSSGHQSDLSTVDGLVLAVKEPLSREGSDRTAAETCAVVVDLPTDKPKRVQAQLKPSVQRTEPKDTCALIEELPADVPGQMHRKPRVQRTDPKETNRIIEDLPANKVVQVREPSDWLGRKTNAQRKDPKETCAIMEDLPVEKTQKASGFSGRNQHMPGVERIGQKEPYAMVEDLRPTKLNRTSAHNRRAERTPSLQRTDPKETYAMIEDLPSEKPAGGQRWSAERQPSMQRTDPKDTYAVIDDLPLEKIRQSRAHAPDRIYQKETCVQKARTSLDAITKRERDLKDRKIGTRTDPRAVYWHCIVSEAKEVHYPSDVDKISTVLRDSEFQNRTQMPVPDLPLQAEASQFESWMRQRFTSFSPNVPSSRSRSGSSKKAAPFWKTASDHRSELPLKQSDLRTKQRPTAKEEDVRPSISSNLRRRHHSMPQPSKSALTETRANDVHLPPPRGDDDATKVADAQLVDPPIRSPQQSEQMTVSLWRCKVCLVLVFVVFLLVLYIQLQLRYAHCHDAAPATIRAAPTGLVDTFAMTAANGISYVAKWMWSHT